MGVLKSDPSLSTSLFPDHWAWSSKIPHIHPCPTWVKAVEGWSHHNGGKGLLCPPPYKVRFKLGRMGPHAGLPQEEGFWARVCKAIFLCGGKGRWGDEHWVWGEGEEWWRGKEEGASLLEHSHWSHSDKETRICTRSRACLLPAHLAWPHPTSRGPFQDPREGFGGTAAEPFTLALRAPSLFSPSRSRE